MILKDSIEFLRACGVPEAFLTHDVSFDGDKVVTEGKAEVPNKRPKGDIYAEAIFTRMPITDFDEGKTSWQDVCNHMKNGDCPEGPAFWDECAKANKLTGPAYKRQDNVPMSRLLEGLPNTRYWQVELRGKDMESLEYKNGKRWQEIRIGRGLRKAYPFWDDSTVERATNAIKAEYMPLDFRTLSGNEIIWAYDERNSKTGSGTLNQSCLRQTEKHRSLRFFTQFPDKIQLLVAMKGRKITGRALVWKADCGTTIMDRIYANDATTQKFILEAERNGWVYKYRQNYESQRSFLRKDSSRFTKTYKVSLDWSGNPLMPYLDTFHYGGQGFVTNEQTNETFARFRRETGKIEMIGEYSQVEGRYVSDPVHMDCVSLVISQENAVRDDLGNLTHKKFLVTNEKGQKVCSYSGYLVGDKVIPTNQIDKLYEA